ncbi:MAG: sulfotransferase domain-containing protein [Candidatus Thorarchaeota archaeon]
MKFLIFFLCSLSFLYTQQKFIDLSKPKEIVEKEFLLGCKRSGNNWTIAILQILIGKPVRTVKNPEFENYGGFNRLGLDLDQTKSILYRTHNIYPELRQIDQSKNKLIFIIRNYKECLVRGFKYTAKELYSVVLGDKAGFKHYIENLQFYENWKDETKFIIFYEDLIFKPQETIKKLLAFLNRRARAVSLL